MKQFTTLRNLTQRLLAEAGAKSQAKSRRQDKNKESPSHVVIHLLFFTPTHFA